MYHLFVFYSIPHPIKDFISREEEPADAKEVEEQETKGTGIHVHLQEFSGA